MVNLWKCLLDLRSCMVIPVMVPLISSHRIARIGGSLGFKAAVAWIESNASDMFSQDCLKSAGWDMQGIRFTDKPKNLI